MKKLLTLFAILLSLYGKTQTNTDYKAKSISNLKTFAVLNLASGALVGSQFFIENYTYDYVSVVKNGVETKELQKVRDYNVNYIMIGTGSILTAISAVYLTKSGYYFYKNYRNNRKENKLRLLPTPTGATLLFNF